MALWDEHFRGNTPFDYEPIKRILTRFPRLELHTFPAGEDESDNPFIGEIKKHGIPIDLTRRRFLTFNFPYRHESRRLLRFLPALLPRKLS